MDPFINWPVPSESKSDDIRERGECVPLFDDASSYGHAVIGAALPFLSVPLALLVAGLFVIYQVREIEPRSHTIGDLSEFAIGYAGGSVLSGR